MNLDLFEEIWLVDFEYRSDKGENPDPVCKVARELRTGRTIRMRQQELKQQKRCPFRLDSRTLYVSYYAIAEISCHLELGWELPSNLLDLFAEFRCRTNGLELRQGSGLLGSLAFFDLPAIESAQKEAIINLILNQQTWSEDETQKILDYCESDVHSLVSLTQKMSDEIDLLRAPLRGEFMKAMAEIERRGIPIDTELMKTLEDRKSLIRDRLIKSVNEVFPFFEDGVFKKENLERFVQSRNLAWPRYKSGALQCDDETFKAMGTIYGEPLLLLREARSLLSKMRTNSLSVGTDGRNRCGLSAFRSITSRNQPSSSQFIFGQPAWLRSLIRPLKGRALAYIDWAQQEFAIAAALSRDAAMLAAYSAGDPYLAFAKQTGAIPQDGTKESHKRERELFKACILAVQYGMAASTLAARINQPKYVAEKLLRLHKQTYPEFWKWSDAAVDYAMSVGEIKTTYGWRLNVTKKLQKEINTRSLRNFPMQANGAEMMRLATIFATRAGVEICAPVHDAFLIEADEDDINESVWAMQDAMAEASRTVLDGVELRTDVKVVWAGERYEDPRGANVWDKISDLVSKDQVSISATDLMLSQPPLQSNVLFDERDSL